MPTVDGNATTPYIPRAAQGCVHVNAQTPFAQTEIESDV